MVILRKKKYKDLFCGQFYDLQFLSELYFQKTYRFREK